MGQLQEAFRVDCHPDSGVSEESCSSRGCLFQAANDPKAPSCYYPPDFGYQLIGQVQQTETGFLAELVKSGPAVFVPNEFNFILMEVEFQTETRLRIKLHPNVPRYEV